MGSISSGPSFSTLPAFRLKAGRDNMNRTGLVIATCAALVGCAPQIVWVKPGASTQDFKADEYSCERDAQLNGHYNGQSGYYGGEWIGPANMQPFFNRCLVARGWNLSPIGDW